MNPATGQNVATAASLRDVAVQWMDRELAPSLSAALWNHGVRVGLAILLVAMVWGGCGFAYSSLIADAALPEEIRLGGMALATAILLLTAVAVLFYLQRQYLERLRASATIALTRIDLLAVLGKLTELRDRDTAGHNLRVTLYTLLFAETLKLPPLAVVRATVGAMIHDIGKLAVPDSILGKKGALTTEERAEMQTHVLHGAALIAQSELLNHAAPVLIGHHERYDGTGYPRGLKGEEIPLEARMFALIDAFDALTSVRAYKPALSMEAALQLMAGERGSHFDPVLLDRFAAFAHRFVRQLPRDEIAVMNMLLLRLHPYFERLTFATPTT